VPQVEQKDLSTFSEDLYKAGSPAVKEKSAPRIVAQPITGAPLDRLQLAQWHRAGFDDAPRISYRTAPHRQPPVKKLDVEFNFCLHT
jgi:hypothetical protein